LWSGFAKTGQHAKSRQILARTSIRFVKIPSLHMNRAYQKGGRVAQVARAPFDALEPIERKINAA